MKVRLLLLLLLTVKSVDNPYLFLRIKHLQKFRVLYKRVSILCVSCESIVDNFACHYPSTDNACVIHRLVHRGP